MLDQIPLVRGIVSLSNDGGPFVLLIYAAGVLMWALVIERYWYFTFVLPKQAANLQAEWHGAGRTVLPGAPGRSARR